MQPAIETIALTRRFGSHVAVDRLTLQVEPGAFFGFLGPNGAGKSTTIKMLVGLLRPTAGEAWIDGIDVWRHPIDAKRRVGVLPEGLNLYERLTAREYVEFVGLMHGLTAAEARRRTDELLDLMQLTAAHDKMLVDYSHGMRKKTALAAALIHGPRVLFLDEPFEGIDAVAKRAILNVLQDLRQRGTTIFFSSHILEVVERLCTRVAVIAEGRLVAEGTLDALRERAHAGAEATLEDLFLAAINSDSPRPAEGGAALSWLDTP